MNSEKKDQSQNSSITQSQSNTSPINSSLIPEESKKILITLLKKRLDRKLSKFEHKFKEDKETLKYIAKKFTEFEKTLIILTEGVKETQKVNEEKVKKKEEEKKQKEIIKVHTSKSQAPHKKLKINTKNDYLTNRTVLNINKNKTNINNISSTRYNYHTEIPKKEHERPKTFKGRRPSDKEFNKIKVKPIKVDKITNISTPIRPEDNKAKTIISLNTDQKYETKKVHNSVIYNKKSKSIKKKIIPKNLELTKNFSDVDTHVKKLEEFKSEKPEKKSITIIQDKLNKKHENKKGNGKKTVIKKTNDKIKKSQVKKDKKEEEKKEKNNLEEPNNEIKEKKANENIKEENKKDEKEKEEEDKLIEKEDNKIIEEKKENEIKKEKKKEVEKLPEKKDEIENKNDNVIKLEEKEEKKIEETNINENVSKNEEQKKEEIIKPIIKEEENMIKKSDKIDNIDNKEEPPKEEKVNETDKKEDNLNNEKKQIISEKEILNALKEEEQKIIKENETNNLLITKEEEPKKEEVESPKDIKPLEENKEQKETLNKEEEKKNDEKINENKPNNENVIDAFKKQNEEMKKENDEELLKHYQSQYIDINLNQSINQNMSFSQSFLQSRSILGETPQEKIVRDPNAPLTRDEIIKKYKNYFIYVFDFLDFKERIMFSGVHKGFKNERIYLLNTKREEAIASLELKERETLNDRINKFMTTYSKSEYTKPLGKFTVARNSATALLSIDKEMFSKIFKQKVLDIKLSDIYIVYRALFVLIGEEKIAEIVDDGEFWIKCTEYLNTNGKNKIGSFILEKSKNFDFSHKSIYLLNKLLVGIKPKFNPASFSKINGTTGLVIFIIKDALEYAGILITSKTPKSRIYDNLIYYKNLIEPLTNFIDFLSKIKVEKK